jgi:hypothetical protein
MELWINQFFPQIPYAFTDDFWGLLLQVVFLFHPILILRIANAGRLHFISLPGLFFLLACEFRIDWL